MQNTHLKNPSDQPPNLAKTMKVHFKLTTTILPRYDHYHSWSLVYEGFGRDPFDNPRADSTPSSIPAFTLAAVAEGMFSW